MAFGQGRISLTLEELLNKVSEDKILAFYLGVLSIPTVINSPLRTDNHPSFGLYSSNGKNIYYKDFSTGDSGSLIELLQKMWRTSFMDTLERIDKDFSTKDFSKTTSIETTIVNNHTTTYSGNTKLEVKIREWREYDINYWNDYGISIDLLKKANVYPISHYIITKNNQRYVFGADKLAYAYVEFKEKNVSIKVYQPYNKGSFKWINKHDRSVLGLWSLMPKQGKTLVICSSVKDALCLFNNSSLPAICLQGEGYTMSETAIKELKKRFKYICICLDNDECGIIDAEKLAKQTGFINVVLPQFEGGKDISDYYKSLEDKSLFKTNIIQLFNKTIQLWKEKNC